MGERPSKWRVALTAGRLAGRRLLRRAEGERDEQLGEMLTGQLDQMKGLAMKLGQIVSYMDVPLPESAQRKLAQLQSGMSGMSEEKTRAALADALGADFEERFESLDLAPIAAASIGQVHRARIGDKELALKVRYPEVAHSFEKDLGGLSSIASLASVATAVDGRAIVRELGERLAEECDYAREAAFQTAFRDAFADDAEVQIPEVFAPLTTASTLATTWSDGVAFVEARDEPQAQRDAYARILVRFAYRCLLNLATIQADPHPGNYLFGPGGSVTFLDFGCVREFEPGFVEGLRSMIDALARGDHRTFREAVVELGMTPKPKKFDFEHHFEMMEHLHRPLLAPEFSFTPEYVKQGLAYNGPSNPNARHMSLPAPYIWVARLQWGLWSVLTRLRATVRLREMLDAVMASPVTPLTRSNQDAASADAG